MKGNGDRTVDFSLHGGIGASSGFSFAREDWRVILESKQGSTGPAARHRLLPCDRCRRLTPFGLRGMVAPVPLVVHIQSMTCDFCPLSKQSEPSTDGQHLAKHAPTKLQSTMQRLFITETVYIG